MKKKLLFIGDSITEDGKFNDKHLIGLGYVHFIQDYLMKESIAMTVVNKGVSGNRITDLAKRWQTDVIQEQPDFLSISIGINDVWRQLDQPDIEQVSPIKFEEIYCDLLDQVKQHTNATIILMEPTIIEENLASQGNHMLKDYVKVIQTLSKTYKAVCIPLHQTCMDYIQNNPNHSLTRDGVHMNDTGRKLMATSWLQTVKKELALH